jgi:hypothetical protein
VLSLQLEWRRSTSELRGRGGVQGSSASGLEGSKSSARGRARGRARDRVRRGGGGGSLGRRVARNKGNGLGGSRTCLVGLGSEVHLGDGDGGGTVCDGGAGGRRGRSFTWDLTGNLRRGSGRRNTALSCRSACTASRGRSRSRVERDVGGAVGDKTGVLRNVLGADTDEVLERLTGLLVGAAPSGNAFNDLLSEVFVLAVAGRIGVVLAATRNFEPGVHALGKNIRGADRWVAGAGGLGNASGKDDTARSDNGGHRGDDSRGDCSSTLARTSVASIAGRNTGTLRRRRLNNRACLVGRRGSGSRSRVVSVRGSSRECRCLSRSRGDIGSTLA